jgi:ribosome-associated toxin RatA of RatAB toxin-antitoxin module
LSAAVTDRISIAADPAAVMAVIADVGAYPDWQDEIKSAEVLDVDGEGRPRRARFTVDAKIFTTTYTLVYTFAENHVSWQLEEGDQLDALSGSYTLSAAGEQTEVGYELTVDPKMPVPGLLRRQAAKRIADGALKGLRRRVERGA